MRAFDTALMRARRPDEAPEMPSSETDPYYGMRGLGQDTGTSPKNGLVLALVAVGTAVLAYWAFFGRQGR